MAGVMDELRLDFGSPDVLFVSISSLGFPSVVERHNLGLPCVGTSTPSAASGEHFYRYVNPDENHSTEVQPRLSGQGMLKVRVD